MSLVNPPDEPTFYMTANANLRQLEPLTASGDIPVMRNVMQFRRSDGTLSTRDVYAGRYVLDSGGYTAMDEFGGDFPWTVAEYHEWAREMYAKQPFGWVAVMDLACEPAFDDDLSVEERINRTVDNTISLLDHDPEYPVLPVLQGRTVEQWVDCYDRLRDHGIDPEYAGVGTMCRQTSGKDIRDIIRALRVRTDIDAFHGFGVKATAFKENAFFESADSQAWSWPIKFGIMLEPDDSDPPKPKRVKYDDHDGDVHRTTFKTYYDHVSRLHRAAEPTAVGQQTAVSSFR